MALPYSAFSEMAELDVGGRVKRRGRGEERRRRKRRRMKEKSGKDVKKNERKRPGETR